MAEIINLNRARKAKAKSAAKQQAASNRLTFGRTKADRDATETANQRAQSHLDAHKLDD